MEIQNKKLTPAAVDSFIDMRIKQLREEGAREDIDLKPALREYYDRHMDDGTFVAWLAVVDDKIIGTSGMSFVQKPPYYGCPTGKTGLLSSVFIEKFLPVLWQTDSLTVYFQACLSKKNTADRVLQRCFYQRL